MPSFVFRAVAGVVNGAACAVNHLVQVISPVDIGHIWEDVPAGASGGPAPTDPPSGGVADPAAETVTPDLSAAGSPLTWAGWSLPAVLEALAEHRFMGRGEFDPDGSCSCGFHPVNLYDWHEHIAPLIIERIACNPAKAVAALQNLQTQE